MAREVRRRGGDSSNLLRTLPWGSVGLSIAAIGLTAAIGLLAAVALQWSTLSRYSVNPAPAERVAASPPQVIPTPVPPAINTIQFDVPRVGIAASQPAAAPAATAPPAEAPVAAALPAAVPVATAPPVEAPLATAAPAEAPVATAAPPAQPTAVPSPTAAEAWSALAPQLDAVWSAQTSRAISLLQDFLARYPDYPVAQEKLYAALLADATQLREAGQPSAAVDRAEQATALLPDRGEAGAFLLALTPTPVPVPRDDTPSSAVSVAPQPAVGSSSSPAQVRQAPVTTQAPPRPAPTPRPQAPVRSAPAAPAAPAAPPPAALPTKVPFVPPAP